MRIIVANWKMNPTNLKEAKALFISLLERLKKLKRGKKLEVVVCPPFVYLPVLKDLNKNNLIKLGAQNCFWEEKGAFTGEISPLMLKELNVNYLILGHSERRIYLKETNKMIGQKLKKALQLGFKPILCLGSKKKGHREQEDLKKQMREILKDLSVKDLLKIIFAYEPIWAISSFKNSQAATFLEARKGKELIKKLLKFNFKIKKPEKIKIIYGGSVTKTNAQELIKKGKADGFLVGSASLRIEEFSEIIKMALF